MRRREEPHLPGREPRHRNRGVWMQSAGTCRCKVVVARGGVRTDRRSEVNRRVRLRESLRVAALAARDWSGYIPHRVNR